MCHDPFFAQKICEEGILKISKPCSACNGFFFALVFSRLERGQDPLVLSLMIVNWLLNQSTSFEPSHTQPTFLTPDTFQVRFFNWTLWQSMEILSPSSSPADNLAITPIGCPKWQSKVWLQSQWLSSLGHALAQLRLIWQQGTNTVSQPTAVVAGSNQLALRKNYYHFCYSDLVWESKRL